MLVLGGAVRTSTLFSTSLLTMVSPTTRWLVLKQCVDEEGATKTAEVTVP